MTDRTEKPMAFPVVSDNCTHSTEFGMTLRDYFAGQALAGLLAADAIYSGKTDQRDTLAADAYATADAMLAERAKS